MRILLSTLDRRRSRAWSRRSGRAIPTGDRGETLIELLVTVVILGTAVVALVGGLALAVRVSDMHRKQATAGAAVRAFAEALQTMVAATPTGYVDCADDTTYEGTYTGAPAGYVPDVTAVSYWDGAAFVATCTTDTGVQRVSLTVASADGRASESLDVVLRKPCRLGESCV
jgi:type II secretory pathway pseudopilin PulG